MSSSKNKREPESSEKRKVRKLDKKRKKENQTHDETVTTTSTSKSESMHEKGGVDKINKLFHESISNNNAGNEKSPFEEKQVQILVSLPPSALANIPSALNTSMQSLLLKYSDSLGGVLISYGDITIDNAENGKYGRIINEMPHIHYKIKCSVLVFNPSPGAVLQGRVNESFPSHIGLLVHELFNGMISANLLRRNGFTFDDETHEWRKHGSTADRIINVDDAMEVTVDTLHECNGLISLDCKDPVFFDEMSETSE